MLVSPPRNFLDVPVADRTPGVKQQARWLSMLAAQHPITGELTVNLELQVTQHAAADGTLLQGRGIDLYKVPLVANNNTAVEPTTGELRYLLITDALPARGGEVLNLLTGEKEPIAAGENWLIFLETKPENLLLQGDWFMGIMEKMGITALLQQFMQQADTPPFSKFS